MADILKGRYSAQPEASFVVFLIGMSIHSWWQPQKWIPTMMEMGPMLATLFKHPEKGLLGTQPFLYPGGLGIIQYWRSFEDLEAFAKAPAEPHVPAWRRFNRRIGTGGSVGIWHETYLVEAGKSEAVYVNMRPFGLGAATCLVPVGQRGESARERIAHPSAS